MAERGQDKSARICFVLHMRFEMDSTKLVWEDEETGNDEQGESEGEDTETW